MTNVEFMGNFFNDQLISQFTKPQIVKKVSVLKTGFNTILREIYLQLNSKICQKQT